MRHLSAIIISLGCAAGAFAQGNYEVQVYGSDLMPKDVTMVELHSNFTASGTKGVVDGVLPTNHAVHETLEITHGWNEWFETGFYQFTSIQSDGSWQWVGTHIRPRVAMPERYKLPVGLSLSDRVRISARRSCRPTPGRWEIRPIIDKKIGKLYVAFNPTFEQSFTARSRVWGFEFSPNVKFSYDVTKKVAFGVEYYGSYGPVTGWDPVRDQQQQMFCPRWISISGRTGNSISASAWASPRRRTIC